jgi:hypothetical protein
MTMWREIKDNYRLPARFMLALPLVAAVPIVVEAVQHLVEWRIGMFDSLAGAAAVESHPARMGVGYVKIASLLLVGFFVWRFLAFDSDRRQALRIDGTALRLFAPVMAFQVALVVAQSQAGGVLGALVPAGRPLILAGLAAMLVAMALELYLASWKVGLAAGNQRMTLAASIRTMRGNIGWSFGFTLAMFFPVMILHYLLNGLAIGRPTGVVAAMLAVDCLVVGYLAALFPTTVFIVARRAAARAEANVTSSVMPQPLPA